MLSYNLARRIGKSEIYDTGIILLSGIQRSDRNATATKTAEPTPKTLGSWLVSDEEQGHELGRRSQSVVTIVRVG